MTAEERRRRRRDSKGYFLERKYAALFGVKPCGGTNDGGIDFVPVDGPLAGVGIQVKPHWKAALRFLEKQREKGVFIPIVVGPPPDTREEVELYIELFGGWIPKKEDDRRQKVYEIRYYRMSAS